MRTCILAFTSSIVICTAAHAELKWEQTTVELHPAITDKEAVGHFKYQNTGSKPVRFQSVHTSCGCTAAQTQKDEVPPGEKGEITATFNIGDRTGTQVKTITVDTDDAKAPQTVLKFTATIAQILDLQPTFVFWQAGEAAQPKTIIAKVAKGVTVKKVDVVSSSGDFTAKVDPGPTAGEFKIEIQPKETTKPLNATLTIKPDVTPAKVYYASARVLPPGTAKP